MTITIKQPAVYVDFAAPDWVEPYDHILVDRKCGNLMERGMGLCDKCIERESLLMQADLISMAKEDEDEPEGKTIVITCSSSNNLSNFVSTPRCPN